MSDLSWPIGAVEAAEPLQLCQTQLKIIDLIRDGDFLRAAMLADQLGDDLRDLAAATLGRPFQNEETPNV